MQSDEVYAHPDSSIDRRVFWRASRLVRNKVINAVKIVQEVGTQLDSSVRGDKPVRSFNFFSLDVSLSFRATLILVVVSSTTNGLICGEVVKLWMALANLLRTI